MKPPLVLTSTRTALEEAARLGMQRPLENAVLDALTAGNVEPITDDEARVFLDADLVVTVRRSRSALGNRGWQPIAIRRGSR